MNTDIDFKNAVDKINNEYPEYNFDLEIVKEMQFPESKKNMKGIDPRDIVDASIKEVGVTIKYDGNPFQMACVIVSAGESIDVFEKNMKFKCQKLRDMRKKNGTS